MTAGRLAMTSCAAASSAAMVSCASPRSLASWLFSMLRRMRPAADCAPCRPSPTVPRVTSTGPTAEYFKPRPSRWLGVNRTSVFELMSTSFATRLSYDHSLPPTATPRRRLSGRRSEEHTSELESQFHLVCRLLLEKKNKKVNDHIDTHS